MARALPGRGGKPLHGGEPREGHHRPFTAQQISDKITERSAADLNAEVRILYQSIEGLHDACPTNTGDWYFTGTIRRPVACAVDGPSSPNPMEGRSVRGLPGRRAQRTSPPSPSSASSRHCPGVQSRSFMHHQASVARHAMDFGASFQHTPRHQVQFAATPAAPAHGLVPSGDASGAGRQM